MNICTSSIDALRPLGEEKGIEVLAKAGFDSIDFSLALKDYSEVFDLGEEAVVEHFSAVRKMLDKNGIYAWQAHAPFPLLTSKLDKNEYMRGIIKLSIIATHTLGARYMVTHPPLCGLLDDGTCLDRKYDINKEENLKTVIDYYSELIPYLYEYDVKVAIENIWTVDENKGKYFICPTTGTNPYEMAEIIDTLNAKCSDTRFVTCLDVGHTNLSCRDMPIRRIINILGHRLKTVHIHDNDGTRDTHKAPGFGIVDWEGFCLGLRDIGYDGDFVFEANDFCACFDKELLPYSASLLYQIGRNMCEKYGL